MTKDELKKKAEECWKSWYDKGGKEEIPELLYMFAEPREKRIAELEKENEELRNNGFTVSAMTEQQLKAAIEKGKQLEKENAELKKEIEKHKWNDIFLEDCAGYDKKIAEEYSTLQERNRGLEQQIEKMKCDNRDSIMLQIETNIRKAFSKCNGLELLLICKVIDIVRDTLSE